nr:MAG TPA: hypothetical protein [Caudoviricetes sp.]
MVPRRPPRPPVAGLPRRVEGAGAVLLTACQHLPAIHPAGLAWSAICCTVWHGSITGAHHCPLIYLIIIGRLC